MGNLGIEKKCMYGKCIMRLDGGWGGELTKGRVDRTWRVLQHAEACCGVLQCAAT